MTKDLASQGNVQKTLNERAVPYYRTAGQSSQCSTEPTEPAAEKCFTDPGGSRWAKCWDPLSLWCFEDYGDAIIGSLGVEHRKRTTIGVELAVAPGQLLMIDPPTVRRVVPGLRPSLTPQEGWSRTVYLGNSGHRSSTTLEYFGRNDAPRGDPKANPAEYMLDVVGAGATATSSVDWHSTWRNSSEAAALQEQTENFHDEGQARPVIRTRLPTEFATSWAYWCNPTYLMAKFAPCLAGGLPISLTFHNASDSLQDIQNKLFATLLASVLYSPLIAASKYVHRNSVYLRNPRAPKQGVQLDSSYRQPAIPERAGYTYLMHGVVFPPYYATVAQAVTCMAPSAAIALLLFSALFSFVVILCTDALIGCAICLSTVSCTVSCASLVEWMYHVSTFTYFIESAWSSYLADPDAEKVSSPPHGTRCESSGEIGRLVERRTSVAMNDANDARAFSSGKSHLSSKDDAVAKTWRALPTEQ
ncbi:hypothetical protein M405DRAFT_877444 [Rhizopogon salebrosus TDB-379]|nr:hypothetical protein M405DRAFT_877444 [Rhizopogon salebrosus TDB-379]